MAAVAVIVTGSAATLPGTVSAQATLPLLDPPMARTWYTPVVPARLLDTRAGMATIDGGGRPRTPLGQGRTLGLRVLGRGGVPASGVSAVVLNVTAANPTARSFLTVWPHGVSRPTASNLNVVAGQTRPNLVVAKVGVGGVVDVFNYAGQVDVIVDVSGYVPATDGYVPLVPARLLDSRFGYQTIDGKGRPGVPVRAQGTMDLQVLGRGGVPSTGVDSVVLNVTVTNPTAQSHLTVYPSIASKPTASNLNFVAGQTVANSVIVKVSPPGDPISQGRIRIYNHSGTVDVVVDVAGYFPTGGTFVSVLPSRIFETRPGESVAPGGLNRGQWIGADQSIDVQVTGLAGVPDFGVSAVVLNVTAVRPADRSYLTVWPTGTTRPNASNLNVRLNDIVPNLVVAKVGAGGKVSIYNYSGYTDLVVDVAGYFEAETGVIRDVVAAAGSTCTLFDVGTLWCWGDTPQDDTLAYPGFAYPGHAPSIRPAPYEVNTVDDAVAVALGDYHTCVIRTGGSVWCWSMPTVFNLAGNGAPGEPVDAWPQIQVRLPRPAVHIDAGYTQTCALLVDSTVWCWGMDYAGVGRPLPWRVGNLDAVVDVAVGDFHACALRSDGTVRCWGTDFNVGALGDGTGADSPTSAVVVSGLTDADGVSVSGLRSCATRTNNDVRCWGSGLGLVPVDLQRQDGLPVGNIAQVVHGDEFICALDFDGQVSCSNGAQLDLPIAGLPPSVYLAAGRFHICAVTAAAELYCWGTNEQGQLGDGTLGTKGSPIPIITYG